MGGPAANIGLDDILRRRGHRQTVRRALAVKNYALPGGQAVKIQMMRPHQAALLGPGKDHFHRPMRRFRFPHGRQGFQHNSQAGLAVAA